MKARLWMEHLAPKECGNELMAKIAAERFAADPRLDVVEVWEHGGWHLSFRNDGRVVGTANDMAQFSREVLDWGRQFDSTEFVGECRRSDDGNHQEHRREAAFPRLAACA